MEFLKVGVQLTVILDWNQFSLRPSRLLFVDAMYVSQNALT